VAPIVPSLQSYWLVIHVLFMTIGIAFFTSGFGASALLLIERYSGRSWVDPERLEELAYKAIVLGFPFYGIGGIVFGGLWANKAWGSYWSWDPKETAMLGAWLVYAVYLHVRMAFGWRDLRATWLSIAGYLAILYAWIGINYFVASLHSFI
jgi:cytochrome c-type biogenesis protein CcsB